MKLTHIVSRGMICTMRLSTTFASVPGDKCRSARFIYTSTNQQCSSPAIVAMVAGISEYHRHISGGNTRTVNVASGPLITPPPVKMRPHAKRRQGFEHRKMKAEGTSQSPLDTGNILSNSVPPARQRPHPNPARKRRLAPRVAR